MCSRFVRARRGRAVPRPCRGTAAARRHRARHVAHDLRPARVEVAAAGLGGALLVGSATVLVVRSTRRRRDRAPGGQPPRERDCYAAALSAGAGPDTSAHWPLAWPHDARRRSRRAWTVAPTDARCHGLGRRRPGLGIGSGSSPWIRSALGCVAALAWSSACSSERDPVPGAPGPAGRGPAALDDSTLVSRSWTLSPFSVEAAAAMPSHGSPLLGAAGAIRRSTCFSCDFLALKLAGTRIVATLFALDPLVGTIIGASRWHSIWPDDDPRHLRDRCRWGRHRGDPWTSRSAGPVGHGVEDRAGLIDGSRPAADRMIRARCASPIATSRSGGRGRTRTR